MMHEHIGHGMVRWRPMLMKEMWEMLPEDKKKILIKRMIDGRIMKKENKVKLAQFKIETLKMAKKMLDEC